MNTHNDPLWRLNYKVTRLLENHVAQRARETMGIDLLDSMTSQQIRVMTIIKDQLDRHGEVRQKDLVRITGVRPASMSQMLQGLMRRGVVRKKPCPQDNRASLIEFCDEFETHLQTLDTIFASEVQKLEEALGAERIAQWRDILSDVKTMYDNEDNDGASRL